MNYLKKLIYLTLITAIFFTATPLPTNAQNPFPNCRLGIGGPYEPYVGDYNLAQLNTGLYIEWRTRSDPSSQIGLPADIEYLQVVRVHQDKVGSNWHGNGPYVIPASYSMSPGPVSIADRAANQPGSLWLIGNEIERRDWNNGDGTWGGQDEITPELYATAFHEIREIIKDTDPTARIGIGSVIEATPLRLKYLDQVWNSYYDQYGYSMGKDIDVWNIHGFILREVKNSWGAEIPAGLNDTGGFLNGAGTTAVRDAHHNIAYFKQFTEALRDWMAAHGERNKPLINTEYGVLYKELGNGEITPAQVGDYLNASFDYMFNTTDADTGYPADENRLIQGWVWYSLHDDYWNGNLFNPTSKALTSIGTTWKNYVTNPNKPLASQPKVNLLALDPEAAPVTVLPGSTATATLTVDIANSGNTTTATGNNLIIKFWDGVPGAPGSNVIATRTINDLPGCGRFTTVQVQWPGLGPGNHTWYVQAVPLAGEPQTNDNVAQGSVEVIQESSADLVLAKSDSTDPVTVGSPVTYVTTVTNNGPDLATTVIVTETLSGNATLGPVVSSKGSCTGTAPATCQLGNLASGATATVTRVVTPTTATSLVSTAQVVSGIFDPNTPNNVAVETTSTEDGTVDEGGTIKVQKYEDRNANGQRDAGEPSLNDWSMILYNAQNQALASGTTQTIGAEAGWIWFTPLPPGNYKVCEVLPAQGNWVNSDPANGALCKSVTLGAGPAVQTLRLGNYQKGSLTIVKTAAITYDFDFTGSLGNFTLTASSLQDSRQFSNLGPGSYTVAEDPASFPDTTWKLVSVTCKDKNGQTVPINVNLANHKADIPIQSGQQITCTYHNHWTSQQAEDYTTYLPVLVK